MTVNIYADLLNICGCLNPVYSTKYVQGLGKFGIWKYLSIYFIGVLPNAREYWKYR